MIMAATDLLAAQPGPVARRRSARRSTATSAAARATTTSSRRCSHAGRSAARAAGVASATGERRQRRTSAGRCKRKEDPPPDHRPGDYTDDMRAARHAARRARALARGAREDHRRSTRSAALARAGIHAVLTGEDLDLAAPAADGLGPAGRRDQHAEHWPLARGEVKHVGEAVAVVIGEDKYAVVDAAEDVVVEYEPLPVVVDPEAALQDGSPLVARGLRHEQDARVGARRREDMDVAWRRPTSSSSGASSTTARPGAPIEPRGVHRRLPRRRPDAAHDDPDPAPHALVPRRLSCRCREEQHPRRRARRRRRLRRQAQALRRGGDRLRGASRKLGRPVKWTRDALGAHGHHPPRPRPDRRRARSGVKRDGTITGDPHRTSSPTSARTTCCSRRSSRRFTAFVMSGCYKIPRVRTDITGRLHEQVPDRRDPRRRAARGDAHDRGDGRPGRRRARDGPRSSCGARTSSRRRTSRPRSRVGDRLRLRRLPRLARQAAARTSTSTAFRARAGRGCASAASTAASGSPPTWRSAAWRRRASSGPQGVGIQAGFWESAVVRVHPSRRASRCSPAPRRTARATTRLRADRRRPARHRPRRTSRSSTATPAPARTAWAPTARARSRSAARPPRAPPRRSRTRPRRSSPTCSRPRRRTSSSATASSPCAGSPDKGMTLAEVVGRRLHPREPARGHGAGARGDDVLRPGELRLPVRRARVRGRRRRRRPARSTSSATSRSTTAARRSTRCSSTGQVHGGITHAHRAGAVRAHPLRRGRPAGDGHVRRLRLPSAADVPSFETDRTETPSPTNSLGVKGVGEAGTIAASPAVINAVDRRAAAAGRDVHQHAARARCGCGRRSRRRRR